MHDGFKVVRFDLDGLLGDREKGPENTSDWEVIKRFDSHESLAYGVDWSFGEHDTGRVETLIASGSFYDHALYLWSG
jgi:diphthamide biosynthesis protein 7